MAKLPVVSGQECIKALQKLGFNITRQKGSHITLRRADPPTRVTIPNHKEVKPGTLRHIIKDAGLTVDEFNDLLK